MTCHSHHVVRTPDVEPRNRTVPCDRLGPVVNVGVAPADQGGLPGFAARDMPDDVLEVDLGATDLAAVRYEEQVLLVDLWPVHVTALRCHWWSIVQASVGGDGRGL